MWRNTRMNNKKRPALAAAYQQTTKWPPLSRTPVKLKHSVMVWCLTLGLLLPFSSIAANSLDAINYSTLPGNRLQITLQLSEPAEKPSGFTIENPARIALDLANTRNNLAERVVPVGVGIARTINTVESGGRTRVVINLSNLVPYETQVDGNVVYITLDTQDVALTSIVGTSTTEAVTTTPNPVAGSAAPESAPGLLSSNPALAEITPVGRAVTNIDFRRGPNGEGRVIFALSEMGIPVDISQSGDNIVVDFLAADIADALVRRLDVLDFATPIRYVDTFKNDGNIRIVIEPVSRDFEQLAYQSDNIFTVELKPIAEEELNEQIKERFGYTGERLSLNFQDIEVRSVLQLLADFTNLNIVVSDTVTGKLTLRLKNVPWDQALDIILKTKSLGKRDNGNVLLVAPTEEIAARERVELEAQQQVEELAPLNTEFMQINYAKASNLAAILQTEGGGVLSERGSVSVDDRTNTLLIHDIDGKLSEARRLIHRLDIPVQQVLIEARIVVANDGFTKDIGVRFGVSRDTTNNSEGIITSGSQLGITNLLNNATTLGTERFNVNLPAPTGSSSIALALAKLPFGTLLELELSAMQAETRGEIISSPRLITTSQSTAKIEQGVEIPFLEASSSGAATVSFRNAVLSLEVTPQITPDSRVIMDLVVTRDTVGQLFSPGNGVQVPSIDTREVTTQVLVDNGETLVLGGIYEQTISSTITRVPFFADLPLVGRLFENKSNTDNKTELLVFITPQIIKENPAIDY